MQLVILAAGRGQRFGGLKQLAPVGPNGEAIMDYTARSAKECGYEGVVLVVRPEIADEVADHVEEYFPAGLPVEFAFQGPRRGTAQAVFSAAPFVRGSFAVANADDLYGAQPLQIIADHFRAEDLPREIARRHVLVGYQLVRTVLTANSVKRGVLEVGPDDQLRAIIETTMHLRDDGRFDAVPLHFQKAGTRVLNGDERVSMNLWGFHDRIFDVLESALDDGAPDDEELLLPDVIESLVLDDLDEVQVVGTFARCIGITNPEDLLLVQDELAMDAAAVQAPQRR